MCPFRFKRLVLLTTLTTRSIRHLIIQLVQISSFVRQPFIEEVVYRLSYQMSTASPFTGFLQSDLLNNAMNCTPVFWWLMLNEIAKTSTKLLQWGNLHRIKLRVSTNYPKWNFILTYLGFNVWHCTSLKVSIKS